MAVFDPILVKLATEASRDPQKWSRVLDHIRNNTAAQAAIITLRNKKNCQIVNDDALEQKFHSPLVSGFPASVVQYYLTELRTIDPWAEAQINNYPSRPSLMSKICPAEKFKDHRFFNWLNGLGIYDTIAFELECMPDYWTACNLFLADELPSTRQCLVDYATTHQDLLKNTWQASQDLVRGHQLRYAAFDVLSDMNIPAAVVDARNGLLVSNHSFDAVLQTGEVKLIGPRKTISICHETTVLGSDLAQNPPFARHECSVQNYSLTTKLFSPDPLYKNKKEKQVLITLQRVRSKAVNNGSEWNTDSLSRQEKDLFHAIADGKTIQEAGQSIGYKRSQTYKYWDEVKKKLSISSAHQLR